MYVYIYIYIYLCSVVILCLMNRLNLHDFAKAAGQERDAIRHDINDAVFVIGVY